jgi:hyperosmotically inducible protein
VTGFGNVSPREPQPVRKAARSSKKLTGQPEVISTAVGGIAAPEAIQIQARKLPTIEITGGRIMKLASQVTIRIALFAALFMSGWAVASAQQTTDQSATPQADNTKMNQQDRNANEPTADQQKADRSDREITQQIRKSITGDKSLSSYGHNVKVITQNGMVTLKGPVRSEEEKKAVEAKAAEVAGADKVTNEIDVQPKH